MAEQKRQANEAARARQAADRTEQWTANVFDQAVKMNQALLDHFELLTVVQDRIEKMLSAVAMILNGQPLADSINELVDEVRESNQRIEDHLYLAFQIDRFALSYLPIKKPEDKKIVDGFLKDIDDVERQASADSLRKQIAFYSSALNKLKEQEARFAGIAPADVVLRIEEVQATIERLRRELAGVDNDE